VQFKQQMQIWTNWLQNEQASARLMETSASDHALKCA